MIVICNAVPKSASSLLHWYVKELVLQSGAANGFEELTSRTASGQIAGADTFVERLDETTVNQVVDIAREHGIVVVKCHAPLTERLEKLLRSENCRAVISIRDPRDVFLSARDHAIRDVANARGSAFAEYLEVVDGLALKGIRTTAYWASEIKPWFQYSCVVRYEEITTSPMMVLQRLSRALDLPVSEDQLTAILAVEREERSSGRLEFNGAHTSRYSSEIPEATAQRLTALLATAIADLGY